MKPKLYVLQCRHVMRDLYLQYWDLCGAVLTPYIDLALKLPDEESNGWTEFERVEVGPSDARGVIS